VIAKILGSKWLLVGVVGLLLSLAAMTHAYFDQRDKRVEAEAENSRWEASNKALQDALERQARLQAQAEQARIRLAQRVEELSVQEVHVVTRIEERWRDPEVIREEPDAAACAGIAMPSGTVGMLCDHAGSDSGACALRAPADGPADGLSDPSA